MKGRLLTLGGLGLALVALLAVNILSNRLLGSVRLDLTENRLFTLSEGTARILAKIDEPISLRLYLSRGLAARLPGASAYAQRVRAVVHEYERRAGGKLRVQEIDPEPFSEEEDRAVGYGLRGIPVNDGEDIFYFGLVAGNSTGEDAVIPYFARERAKFLEYDLSKLIHGLSFPEKKVVGVLSTLPIDGMGPQAALRGITARPWAVMEQMRQLFDVRTLDRRMEHVPDDIDVLVLVHPKNLPARALYAIDQFVIGGGHALVFVDPDAESEPRPRAAGGLMPPAARGSDPGPLLEAWGVDFDAGKVAGDLGLAAKVRMQQGGRLVTFDYPVWMTLQPALYDAEDIVTGDLGNVSFGTPGALVARADATTTIRPLIRTTDRARLYDVARVASSADPRELLRDYTPGGSSLALAVRVTGKAKSAFPEGQPPPEKDDAEGGGATPSAPAGHLQESVGGVNLIVVADTDVLSDRFWVDVQEFLGTRIAVPIAANGDFVINALDNLLGSADLIDVRNRGSFLRPFTRVVGLRQAAEARYRSKEDELVARLEEAEQRLTELEQGRKGDDRAVLTAEQRQEIAKFRQEKLRIRKDLRQVRRELRREIDGLERWMKFFNIGLIPLAIGLGALLTAGWRMRRRRRPAAA